MCPGDEARHRVLDLGMRPRSWLMASTLRIEICGMVEAIVVSLTSSLLHLPHLFSRKRLQAYLYVPPAL
jgi:hypothetical protein